MGQMKEEQKVERSVDEEYLYSVYRSFSRSMKRFECMNVFRKFIIVAIVIVIVLEQS